jgi:hypothetical protein
MIYSLSLLLLVLGLVVGIPALRKIISMRQIKKNSGTTLGNVVSTKSAMNTAGWLMGMVSASEMVNHERPLVTYQPPHEKEMSVEVIPSNFLSRRKYTAGESVEVAYDLSEPWRAFLIREWTATTRDLRLGMLMSVTAVILWIVGRLYNLPF